MIHLVIKPSQTYAFEGGSPSHGRGFHKGHAWCKPCMLCVYFKGMHTDRDPGYAQAAIRAHSCSLW